MMPLVGILGSILLAAVGFAFGFFIRSMLSTKALNPRPARKFNKKYGDRSGLGVLYQTGQETLISFKNNQWAITNYSLIGIAAVLGAFILIWKMDNPMPIFKYVAAFLVVLIILFATYLITDLQFGIVASRISLNQMKRVLFSNGTPGFHEMSEDEFEKDTKFFRSLQLPILFYLSLFVGSAIAIYIIQRTALP
jgi:hypothetical protein